MARRSYGSGSLTFRADGNGAETWYGLWRTGGRRVKRALGPKRAPGSRDGLTRTQAEAELRRRMQAGAVVIGKAERKTVVEAGERYVEHLATVKRRKRTTLQDYRGYLGRHLVPHFGQRTLDRIEPDQVERYVGRPVLQHPVEVTAVVRVGRPAHDLHVLLRHRLLPQPHGFGDCQYHLPRAKPPKAIRPTRAMISPIQKLQTIIRTIPTMTMMPPRDMPATPPRSSDLATRSSSVSASLPQLSLPLGHLAQPWSRTRKGRKLMEGGNG
jgi:hypothetical protein